MESNFNTFTHKELVAIAEQAYKLANLMVELADYSVEESEVLWPLCEMLANK